MTLINYLRRLLRTFTRPSRVKLTPASEETMLTLGLLTGRLTPEQIKTLKARLAKHP